MIISSEGGNNSGNNNNSFNDHIIIVVVVVIIIVVVIDNDLNSIDIFIFVVICYSIRIKTRIIIISYTINTSIPIKNF